jgi:hypothetical protein
MKKIVVRLVILLVVLILLAALSVHLFLDKAVQHQAESTGQKLTKVEVGLKFVHISLLSGSGKIKGLSVANPEGFSSNKAIQVGTASLTLKPGSVLSSKVIIPSVNVEGPEISFEISMQGNNLKQLLSNVESAGGTEKEPATKSEGTSKKLEVDDFLVSGGKIHLSANTPLGAKSGTVPLPEIHLKDLGKEGDGITPAELTKQVLQAVLSKAIEAGLAEVGNLKSVGDITKGLGGNTGTVDKVTRGLGDLLKKK